MFANNAHYNQYTQLETLQQELAARQEARFKDMPLPQIAEELVEDARGYSTRALTHYQCHVLNMGERLERFVQEGRKDLIEQEVAHYGEEKVLYKFAMSRL